MEVGIASRVDRLLLDRPGSRPAKRDQDQAALQDAQLAQHPDACMGLFALGIDIDQHGLSPLFADPDGGISVVVAAAHPVPGRQLRLDFSLKVLIGRDQADHGQGLFGQGPARCGLGMCHFTEQACYGQSIATKKSTCAPGENPSCT